MKKSIYFLVSGSAFIVISLISKFTLKDDNFVSDITALIATIIFSYPIFRIVVDDIKQRRMKMHELVLLAILASCAQGEFINSAFIALFMYIAILIESKTAKGASKSLESLTKLSLGMAHKVSGDDIIDIEPNSLAKDDIIEVRPGENILADGIIVKGLSAINEANITGESLPRDKTIDDKVYSGTTNLNGILLIKVEKAGQDTTIGKVKQLIVEAEKTRLPLARIVDNYIKYYTPLVLIVAMTVLFISHDISRIVALLVAFCPIALILATPTAVVASLSSAARRGILIKDINDIEQVSQIDTFVFDKTGTLSTGNLEVVLLKPDPSIDAKTLISKAASAEAGSSHPVAQAIISLADKANVTFDKVDELHEEAGRGVKAKLNDTYIYAGNLLWMEDNKLTRENFFEIDEENKQVMSLLFIAQDNKPLGWIGLADKARIDSKTLVSSLQENNVNIAMISGDRAQVVKEMAEELEIEDYQGECSPVDKVEYIAKLMDENNKVAFVGDGVNDAPALAKSHIGIAMGAMNRDIAIDSSRIALMNNDLMNIFYLKQLSRKMKNTILINFAIGAVFILVGLVLSIRGDLSGLWAALLQVLGTLLVVLNSAKLIREYDGK